MDNNPVIAVLSGKGALSRTYADGETTIFLEGDLSKIKFHFSEHKCKDGFAISFQADRVLAILKGETP
jgi:hypothetical protein